MHYSPMTRYLQCENFIPALVSTNSCLFSVLTPVCSLLPAGWCRVVLVYTVVFSPQEVVVVTLLVKLPSSYHQSFTSQYTHWCLKFKHLWGEHLGTCFVCREIWNLTGRVWHVWVPVLTTPLGQSFGENLEPMDSMPSISSFTKVLWTWLEWRKIWYCEMMKASNNLDSVVGCTVILLYTQ